MQETKQNKKSFTSSYGAEMRPNCPRCGRRQLLLICRQYLGSSNGHEKHFCFLTFHPPHAPGHVQCGGLLCHVDSKKHLSWQTWEGIASQAPLPTSIPSSGFDFSKLRWSQETRWLQSLGPASRDTYGWYMPFLTSQSTKVHLQL